MFSKKVIIPVLICSFWLNLTSSIDLKSRIKTEQIYRSPDIPSSRIYSIDVSRVESSKAEGASRCWSVPRSIKVSSKVQLLRLSRGNLTDNRQVKIYQKLTTLGQQENVIEQFEIIKDKVFVLTSDGLGYFISIQNPKQVHTVQTSFFQNKNTRSLDLIVIKEYKERVLIIDRKKIVLCKFEKSNCEEVTGYGSVNKFRAAQLYESNGRYFLFIVAATEIISYELTANAQLKGQRRYGNVFFGAQKISLRSLIRASDRSLFVLDDIQGIFEMVGDDSVSGNFKLSKKLIYQQFGCYQMFGEKGTESLIIACHPSSNNYFVMNLIKSTQFIETTYQPLQTVFMHQQLYQIQSVESLLMSRVYEGIKLFWISKQLGNPYPYFHRNAGTIFLHNAIQSKLKVLNQKNTIFLAAQDQLLQYQLTSIDPYVACYSPVGVTQQYKLVYSVRCQQNFFTGKQNVCKKEERLNFQTWQHKEVKYFTHIIPFTLLLLGVVLIAYAIYKIYKNSASEVESARRKYNIQEDQLAS